MHFIRFKTHAYTHTHNVDFGSKTKNTHTPLDIWWWRAVEQKKKKERFTELQSNTLSSIFAYFSDSYIKRSISILCVFFIVKSSEKWRKLNETMTLRIRFLVWNRFVATKKTNIHKSCDFKKSNHFIEFVVRGMILYAKLYFAHTLSNGRTLCRNANQSHPSNVKFYFDVF